MRTCARLPAVLQSKSYIDRTPPQNGQPSTAPGQQAPQPAPAEAPSLPTYSRPFLSLSILLLEKKYKEAREAINRSLDDSINQTQGGVKENYLLFLRGLCDYALLLQGLREGQPIKEETVLGIYADFNKALRELDENYREKVKIRTQDLVEDTKVQVPDDMERLLDLIE